MAQDIEELRGGVGGRLLPSAVRFFGDGRAQQQPTKARLESRCVRSRENRRISNVFPEPQVAVE